VLVRWPYDRSTPESGRTLRAADGRIGADSALLAVRAFAQPTRQPFRGRL